MKKLLGLLTLAWAISCSASTLTGTITRPDGTALTGRLRLTLSHPAHSAAGAVIVPAPVTFAVTAGALPGGAAVVGNDTLTPAHTYYWAEYFSAAGTKLMENAFYISGASFNIGSAVPTNITTSNISFGLLADAMNYQYDGAGSVSRSIASKLDEVISVKDFGAIGDGVTDDTAEIQAADTAAGVTGTLYIPQGTYQVNNLTLTAHINCDGVFSINNGQTLTINGPFEVGLYQVFSGAGTVAFGNGVAKELLPQWWGAKGDGVTDDTAAIQKAGTAAGLTKPLYLPGGTYSVTSTPGNFALTLICGIRGAGPNLSIIKNVGTGSALHLRSTYYARYSEFSILGNTLSEDGIVIGSTQIAGEEVAYAEFTNVDSTFNGRHGLLHAYGWATKYDHCKFSNNGGLGVYMPSNALNALIHNGNVFRDCEARWNGGTGNATGDYLKGGVRICDNTSFLWDGGIVESNNAWGFIIGFNTGNYAKVIIIKNTYFEDTPRSDSTTTIGGFIIVDARYERVEVSNNTLLYGGGHAGVTGYAFYINSSPDEYSYFKEWGNEVRVNDRGGTNIREYGLFWDWTHKYVSNNLAAGVHDIAYVNASANVSVSGVLHLNATNSDLEGLYPFLFGVDMTYGVYSHIGTSILNIENGGISAAIASGATIAHGLGVAPSFITVTAAETAATDIFATADATNITVTYAGGGTKTFYWSAKKTLKATTQPTIALDSGTGAFQLTIPAGHEGHIEMTLNGKYTKDQFYFVPSGMVWNDDFVKRAN